MKAKPGHSPVDPAVRKRRIVSLVSFGIVLALFLIIALTAGKQLLAFVGDREVFSAWVAQNPWKGRFTLLGIQMLQVVISIIPGEFVEVAAGYVFGAVEGCLICLVGVTLASCIIFAFTKRFGIRWVEAFIPHEKIQSLSFMQDERKLDFWVFILFFIPGTPKDTLAYLVGLTPMTLGRFLLISGIARIPSVITSTIGGSALGDRKFGLAIAVFAITGVISVAGILVYQKIMKQKSKKALP